MSDDAVPGSAETRGGSRGRVLSSSRPPREGKRRDGGRASVSCDSETEGLGSSSALSASTFKRTRSLSASLLVTSYRASTVQLTLRDTARSEVYVTNVTTMNAAMNVSCRMR